MEKGRQDKGDVQEIDPGSLGEREPENKEKRGEISDQSHRGECVDELPPEKADPKLGAFESFGSGRRSIVFRSGGGLSGSHEPSQRLYSKLRKAPRVLGPVNRKVKSFGIPRIAPIHRRISPGCQRHISIGQEVPPRLRSGERRSASSVREIFATRRKARMPGRRSRRI